MKKKQTPQVIEVSNEELEKIIQRVKEGLSEDDARIIINIIETHKFICGQLEVKNEKYRKRNL
jgi:hypothetical protein